MTNSRKQNLLFAPLVLALVFAGCKGESPTAPTQGGGTPGGGVIPPSGAVVTLTASVLDLEVDQTTVVTANVTQNGAPVPNGTAVEFTTTRGTFADSGTAATLRTTTNGLATVSLSSATAGTAIVSATVNNVTRTSPTITFRARPVTQPKPSTDPTVVSVTPTFGVPTGGEIIRIKGTNFVGRVRVFFDIPGEAQPREAFPVFQDATTIDVVTPNVQLAPGQELVVPIRVVVDADTTNQKTVAAPTPFTFRTVVLTPTLITASPNSGPITGGTRITLFGNGFQAPVQVLFGNAEAQVVGGILFDSIIVLAPPAHAALGNPGTVGAAVITVVNINSGTRASLAGGFTYTPSMTITGITPQSGSAMGGTDVTVNGLGLDGRLQAFVGGVEAQILRTSGTSVLLRTNPAVSPCNNTSTVPGITITNLDTGLTASSPQGFTYLGIQPRITVVTGPVIPGGNVDVTVTNPGVGPLGFGDIKFTVNGVSVIPSPQQVTNGTAPQVFRIAVPSSGFTFPTVSCQTGAAGSAIGTQLGTIDVPVVFTNATTTCTDSATVRIAPPAPNACIAPPTGTLTPSSPTCAVVPGSVVATGTATGTTTLTLANTALTGAQNLVVTSIAPGGTNPGDFTIAPATASIAPGGSQAFTVTFDPQAAGTRGATFTFTTNAGTFTGCVTGNGT